MEEQVSFKNEVQGSSPCGCTVWRCTRTGIGTCLKNKRIKHYGFDSHHRYKNIGVYLNRLERLPLKQTVERSNRSAPAFPRIAQRNEQWTSNPEVTGSNPVVGATYSRSSTDRIPVS